nr:reverse transcriptase domain-containing protein [Tanacetum cinerariifolium]
ETPTPNSEPVVAPVVEPVVAPISALKPNPKSSIPYPSRLHDQKLRYTANDQKEKFFQIFHDLNFNISFADALILMPKFGPTIKSLLTNKDKLFELARTLLNEHCLAVLLKKLPEKLGDPSKFFIPCDFLEMDECLTLVDLGVSINLMPLSVWNKLSLPELSPTCMTLDLADRLISRPVGVAKDVFVKVGTFHFLADFIVVDFDADPRVPLILKRSFLKTGHALIDVYEGELTLRVGKEAVTFNLDQTSRYSANYDVMSGDILLLEEFLNDDPSSPPLPPQKLKVVEPTNEKSSIDQPPTPKIKKTTFMCPYGTFAYRSMPFGLCNAPGTFQRCMMAIFHDMIEKTMEVFMNDFSIFGNSFGTCLSHLDKMLKRCEDNNICLNWEKSHFMVKEGIVLNHKISKNGIEVDKAKVDIARPMTHLLKKDTSFFFSKECVKAFQTLKRKFTEAPILVAPDWDLPFELMCDASDFAIGLVPRQQKTKHFQPIRYASKTMTNAQAHYTTMEKELLAVVYAFEKFWPYLVLSKSIVYTDHSVLKYLFNKQDAKPRLLRWVLLIQEFDITVRDKKELRT